MTGLTQRLAALPAQRRTQFLARLKEHAEAVARRGPTARGDTGPTPLSPAQETFRFFDEASDSRTPLCLRLRGDLDAPALRSALAAVVTRHDALRTAIVAHETGPIQVIAPAVPVELPLVYVDGDDSAQRLAAARALIERRVREPFDLTSTPTWRGMLVQVAPDDHLFLLDVPPIVCDAWSRGVLMRELVELYRSVRDGDAPRLPYLAVQYPDYAVWQRSRLDRGDLDTLAAYWRGALAGLEVLEFPTDRPRGDTPTNAGGTGSFTVGAEGLDRAAELAREEGGSLSDVLMAAFFTLLHRYCGQTDLVIGSPDAYRRHDCVSSVVGCFTDLRVLRTDVAGDPTFRELVQRVRRVSSEAYEHGGLPFDQLLDAVDPIVDPSRSPIFQYVFGVEDAVATTGFPGIATSLETVHTGTCRFDMSWSLVRPASPGADALVTIEFNTDLFHPESIARFARHYDGLLAALTASPDAALSAAEMLSRADQEFLAEVSQGPMRPIRESTIVAEFEARVRESPDSVAVVVTGVETSYAELNANANRLAALLRRHGVEPGTRVGLCLRRDLDLTTAILAVLKTGAAYVPLDTTHPAARVAEIAADANVRAVIAHPEVGRTVSEVDAPVLRLEDVCGELAAMPDHNPPLAARPDDDAYVLYTSGSAGKPKGVLLKHRGVVNFIDSTRELFDLTPADRVLGFASVTFDVSVFEMFSALLTGARLYLATEDERLSIDRLQSLMERAGITVIDLPPTVMPLLAPEKFSDLRIVFVGGEAFSGELVNRWNPGRRLFNGYGPTECTVTMIVEECAGTWDASPPIGLPMANHVAHVLDRDLRQVPIGVPGELVIGGAGLARGYLKRDELTAEKFIPDPFGTAPGGRLYRTGDLVKRLADGRLLFLGRLDQQVKIRGLRIELGEVESALAGFDGVGPVSVQPWADDHATMHLVGYLTRVTEQQVPAIRKHLATLLPSYMIPSYFVVLDELPLTGSGKVDRRRLPAPDLNRGGEGYREGSLTATQRRLLRDVLAAVSSRFPGKRVDGVHPNLRSATDLLFCSADEVDECDTVFLATPHGAAMTQAEHWMRRTKQIIDLTADFRLDDTDVYQRYYGTTHAAPQLLRDFVPGIPELHRDRLRSADRISVPGCMAVAGVLALYPLVAQGLVEPMARFDTRTGSSGSGATAGEANLHAERSGAMRVFAPTGHRHEAEISRHLGIAATMTATGVEAVRGVQTIGHATLRPGVDASAVRRAFRERYQNEPFVRVVAQRRGIFRYPEPKILLGSNFCDVGYAVDEAAGRLVTIAALDNLMKGGAGNAVQCLNIRMGWPETLGLSFPGLHPI